MSKLSGEVLCCLVKHRVTWQRSMNSSEEHTVSIFQSRKFHIYALFTAVSVIIFSLLDSKTSQFASGLRIKVSAIYNKKIRYLVGVEKFRKNYEASSTKCYTLNLLTHMFTCDFLKDKLGGLYYFYMLRIRSFATADKLP